MNFYIGQIFDDPYPPEAAVWCRENDAYLDDYGQNQTIIKAEKASTNVDRQLDFESKFIETSWGWYRKEPKGYSNAPQSIDIIDRLVAKFNGFASQINDMMIFYQEPDFSVPEQCTEEWLIAHQYKHGVCTKQEFDEFYIDFQTRWAISQYK